MDTSARDCLVLFDTSITGRLDAGWRQGVLMQRTKSTKHGPMLDVECYPVWDTRTAQRAKSEAKRERHRKAQERLNLKNAKKRLIRLTNANFGVHDLIVGCEYTLNGQPESDKQAHRDMINYLKRIKYLRDKRGLPPIKYIYITEVTVSAQYGVRYHHHIIMSGGIAREEAEEAWLKRHGGRCNSKRVQPGEKHLSGFACYLTLDKRNRTIEADGKNPQEKAMHRGWNPSKNLIDPEKAATTADKKISIRKVQRIAETMQDFGNAKEIFAKLYPEYELLEIAARQSKWTTGVYITAELKRKDERRTDDKRDTGGGVHRRAAGKRRAGAAVQMGADAGGGVPRA